MHIYEHISRLLLNVHVECHARWHGLRTCTWWEQSRLTMFAAPPPKLKTLISLFSPLPAAAIRQVEKHCARGGVNAIERRGDNSREKLGKERKQKCFGGDGRQGQEGERAGREDANAQFVCAEEDEEEGGRVGGWVGGVDLSI